MSHQTSHLGVLVIRPEVEMQSALSLLALIKPDEVQPRQAIRLRADLELLIRGMDHNPTKSRSPPLPQGHRIYRVNNYLLPFQGHPPSLDLPGLRRTGTQASLTGLNPSTFPPLAKPPPPAGSAHTSVQIPRTRWFRCTAAAAARGRGGPGGSAHPCRPGRGRVAGPLPHDVRSSPLHEHRMVALEIPLDLPRFASGQAWTYGWTRIRRIGGYGRRWRGWRRRSGVSSPRRSEGDGHSTSPSRQSKTSSSAVRSRARTARSTYRCGWARAADWRRRRRTARRAWRARRTPTRSHGSCATSSTGT